MDNSMKMQKLSMFERIYLRAYFYVILNRRNPFLNFVLGVICICAAIWIFKYTGRPVVDASNETPEEDFKRKVSEVDSGEERLLKSSVGTEKLAQDLTNLLFQQQDCDTTIKIKGREFQAHRLILAARSTVFASMYSHNTTECTTGIVEIEDCDPDVFQIFLLFLYSGKLHNVTSENVLSLYVVADKYDVQEVKTECLKIMANNLSVESVCDILVVAHQYKESELLKTATNFFVKNAKKIVVTVKWLSFHKEYPVESNELHIKALEFQNKDS